MPDIFIDKEKEHELPQEKAKEEVKPVEVPVTQDTKEKPLPPV